MAANSNNNSTYPLVAFHFTVDFKGSKMSFSEVSGLNHDVKVVEYRHGDSPEFTSIKMPGLQSFSNIVLKRGMAKGDNDFHKWIMSIKMNNIERRDVTISLLNEDHQPVVTWKVRQVFPVSVKAGNLTSSGNEVAIESIEIAHEGFTIETGS
jgi:phage tail-like protein